MTDDEIEELSDRQIMLLVVKSLRETRKALDARCDTLEKKINQQGDSIRSEVRSFGGTIGTHIGTLAARLDTYKQALDVRTGGPQNGESRPRPARVR